MDIRMPGVDGVEATRLVAGPETSDPVAVLVLITYDMDEYVFSALRAGARGFLLKHAGARRLVPRCRRHARPCGRRRRAAPAEAFAHQPTRRPPPTEVGLLTDREHAVLDLVARGRSNAEIAAELYIEPSTVKTHLGNVLAKLGLRHRIQVVIYAYENGLITPAS
jgi:DNA-binding NarL/FixJ family response regulator